MRHRGMACIAVIVVGASLTSCSVPLPWGVRLNSDGSIDFAECTPRRATIAVDYIVDDELTKQIEWTVDRQITIAEEPQIIEYGRAPRGYVGENAIDPPEDWELVVIPGARVYRSELVEGEWVWQDSDLPFIPDVPCEALR